MNRRAFLGMTAALAASARGAGSMTSKERVEKALQGQEVDRAPFTAWYHFQDEKQPGAKHAESTLAFHQKFHTDLVKVMSDYPFPQPKGEWFRLRKVDDPFPEQIKALTLIRDGLKGQAPFVETLFNSWTVAEKLSSKDRVMTMMREQPSALQTALDVITRSQISHARKALGAGASGIFLAIANANRGVLTPEEYGKFSEPFDRALLQAVAEAPLNVLHLHGDQVYLDRFVQGWPARAINYSMHGTGVPLRDLRAKYQGVLMSGLDERNFRSLQPEQMKQQAAAARQQAGAAFILAPGCSVPNDTADVELSRLTQVAGA